MRILRNGHLGWFTLIFGCVAFYTPNLDAQLLDKIFNRNQDGPGRPPIINRNSPDIDFVRDFGIPTPYGVRVETVKGHQVAFHIQAKTKTPGMRVEFLVRQFPSAGKIISIVSNPQNRSSAVVTYIADPDSGATMDAFTFAARYPGGKYSSAVRCAISIKDAQALIQITPKAEFGKVMVGQSVEKEITISNMGNAPWSTTLNPSPPWKIVSPKDGKIQLPPGRQVEVKINYSPMIGGPSNYNVILNRSPRGSCKLSGEAIVPFEISGEEFELTMNPENNRREGFVLVKCNHDRPMEVFLRTSNRLKTKAAEYTVLLPNRVNQIGVYLEENDVMAFDGGIEIKLKNGFKEVTSVFANTVASKLSVDIPNQLGKEVINFGKVTAGRSAEKGIMLKNVGGELMPLDVSVPEPFRILSNTDRQLTPLESLPVSIGFYPHKSDRGSADNFLTLRTHREEVKIRLVGNALRPPGAPRDIPMPKPQIKTTPTVTPTPGVPVDQSLSSNHSTSAIGSNAIKPKSVPSPDRIKPSQMIDDIYATTDSENFDISISPLGILTKGIVKRERATGLKCAVDFELEKAKARSLHFIWTAPKDSAVEEFEVEMRGQRVNPITNMMESVWAPYPVEIERVDRLVKAKVNDLIPYTSYEFRVFTVDQNGRCSPPSQSFTSMTSRTMDWTYIYASMILVALGLTIWGLVKIIKDRRGEVYQSEFVN